MKNCPADTGQETFCFLIVYLTGCTPKIGISSHRIGVTGFEPATSRVIGAIRKYYKQGLFEAAKAVARNLPSIMRKEIARYHFL